MSLTQDEALKDVHAKIWPGDSASLKEIKERFENLFFNNRLYDLTSVGRIRMNRKLGLSCTRKSYRAYQRRYYCNYSLSS